VEKVMDNGKPKSLFVVVNFAVKLWFVLGSFIAVNGDDTDAGVEASSSASSFRRLVHCLQNRPFPIVSALLFATIP